MNIPFQPGSQKVTVRGEKRYCPYLYRMGQRRYSGRGRGYFRTVSAALTYASQWADRVTHFLAAAEIHMHCVNCGCDFLLGDWVIEEAVENGVKLPLVHKECLDPMEYRNAMRREGTRIFQYQKGSTGESHAN